MTDTAEYWADVKSHKPYEGRQFYHIPGADCGHTHYHEAKKLGNVNCFSCLALIEQGYEHKLEEGIHLTRSERKWMDEEAKRIQFNKKYGKCTCGSAWSVRYNKATKQQFLGCSAYPKCKKSKSL